MWMCIALDTGISIYSNRNFKGILSITWFFYFGRDIVYMRAPKTFWRFPGPACAHIIETVRFA